MKKIRKISFWTLVSLLVIVDVIVTIYLLNYNRYNVSQFGKYSVLTIEEQIGEFKKNDLLIVGKNANDDIKVGDYIFFYDIKSKDSIVSYGKVNSTYKVNEEETTYTMSNNFPLSSDFVIGKGETATVFSGVGLILLFLASRWGFLFTIILPVAVLFIYEIYLFILEIKKDTKVKKA